MLWGFSKSHLRKRQLPISLKTESMLVVLLPRNGIARIVPLFSKPGMPHTVKFNRSILIENECSCSSRTDYLPPPIHKKLSLGAGTLAPICALAPEKETNATHTEKYPGASSICNARFGLRIIACFRGSHAVGITEFPRRSLSNFFKKFGTTWKIFSF